MKAGRLARFFFRAIGLPAWAQQRAHPTRADWQKI